MRKKPTPDYDLDATAPRQSPYVKITMYRPSDGQPIWTTIARYDAERWCRNYERGGYRVELEDA